jgi:hypothetical protein
VPFPTSLRRDPGDPRSLLERIDAQLRERIEEACEFFCLDLLVQLRDAHGRPAPQPDNQTDRNEFKQLVREFIVTLNEKSQGWVPMVDTLLQTKLLEQKSSDQPFALQVFLAKSLPDYWQRFDQATQAFAKARLAASSPRKSFLSRLLNVKREQ